jgi:hypothetical protein
MNSRETCMLRTKLRQVNMEYSALVRDRARERRFVRLGELRTERRALMNLLFGGANSKRATGGCRSLPYVLSATRFG